MGLISKLLSYTRIASRNGAKVSDVKHDPGGGANQTGEHFQAANADAAPLPGDYVLTVDVQRTGGQAVVGFIDPNQEQTADPGEHRTYARDASGAQVVQLHLKADGSSKCNNGAGYYELKANGTVEINGVTIDPAGNITTPTNITSGGTVAAPTVAAATSLTAAGKEQVGHLHPAGTPPGNTGPNI